MLNMENKKYYVLIPLIIIIITGSFYLWKNKLKTNNINNNTEIQPSLVVDNQVKTDSVKNKDPNIVEYEKSLNIWNKLKKQYNDSYTYESSFQSYSGYRNNTKIEVKNGIPVFRSYEEFMFQGPNDIKKLDSFVENTKNLNSNQKGVLAITIDEIYQQCINNYLNVDPKVNNISFKVDSNGIMTYCGYTPENCMDDCNKSVKIEKLEWLK